MGPVAAVFYSPPALRMVLRLLLDPEVGEDMECDGFICVEINEPVNLGTEMFSSSQ